MYQRLIRYRTKPDQADANAKLVEAVYAELHRTRPDGVSYATFRLNDQVTFVHVVQVREGAEPAPRRQGLRRVPGRHRRPPLTSRPSRRNSPRSAPTASSRAKRNKANQAVSRDRVP